MIKRMNETMRTNSTRAAAARSLRARALSVVVLAVLTVAGGLAASGGTGSAGGAAASGSSHVLAFSSGSSAGVHFSGQLDRGSVLQGSDGEVRMELILSADDVPEFASTRLATDLVVVLDRSGSMGGKPIADAIASVRELIGRLHEGDRFALVTYASDARLEIPMLAATHENRTHWHAQVQSIQSGGGTNMAAGVDLATSAVGRNRLHGRASRVIVLSDGHANEGDHSLEGLRARGARAAAGGYGGAPVGGGQN
jgi:Ca-activated chloride channel family protein